MYNKYITQIFYAKHVLYVGYTWDICGIYANFMRNVNESCMGYFWIVWVILFWVYAN